MSFDFASTCAELLPILAFAAIAELAIFRRLMSSWFSDRWEWRNLWYWVYLILPSAVVYALWVWLIIRIAGDELVCLDALRPLRVPSDSAASVRGTIEAAITLLIVIPTIATPLIWILGFAGDRAKPKALKRRPAYLDDEVDLSQNA